MISVYTKPFCIMYFLLALTTNAHAQTTHEDLQHKSSHIHWPKSHKPETADIFAQNKISINAPCVEVWQYLVNATNWPTWYSNASNVNIENGSSQHLQQNSNFTWTTFDLQVESQVAEFEPTKRLAWYGKTGNISAYHTWYLQPQQKSCIVISEEGAKGEGAIAWRRQDEGAMHKGHDIWLTQLKAKAEHAHAP